jgi:hypothetical protein
MANSSVNLVNLDFDSIKASLKSHLRSQSRFQDYDFEGSNMSVLLDVLAYNSYLNSFYLNMISSEMFLDSAQLRDSVVSHAKELNYLPRSFRSAVANVNISITPSTPVSSVVIPAKTTFTSRLGANNYNFVTSEAIALTAASSGTFTATNVNLYEGSYVTDTFVKNGVDSNQRFVLTNPNIDTTSIEVLVSEDSGSSNLVYTQAFSLYGLSTNSYVFFVQGAQDDTYEVMFGDGFTGRPPKSSAIIEISYRVCNGELPNGADTFVNNSSIDGHSNVTITLNTAATSGSISESLDSIKFNAPRSFQTQERAITENDYKFLLQREFPEIQAISVYGGEKEDPPQYGKVYLAIDIEGADGISDSKKQVYNAYLEDKVPLGFTTEIVSPSFVFLDVDSIVKYNYNITTLSDNQIKTRVLNAISLFNVNNLNDFNTTFRYSKFVAAIDESDNSILNNDTIVTPFIRLTPITFTPSSFSLNFNTEILITTPTTDTHPASSERGVYSTNFVYQGFTCQLEDDGIGNIRIMKINTDATHTKITNVGTVDYNSGKIIITGLNVSSYAGSGIKLYVKPVSFDYTVSLRNILTINPSDINVTMVPIRS